MRSSPVSFRRLLLPVMLLAAGTWPAPGLAQDEIGSSRVLVVGTKVAPPFALQGEDGEWRGIAIELWREVAAELGLRFELEERTLEGLLTGLEDGSLDLSVAALT